MAACLALGAAVAMGEIGNAQIGAAARLYITKIENLAQNVGSVTTARGTVEILDAWAAANNTAADQLERFTTEEHNNSPAAFTQVQGVAEKLSRLQQDYPNLFFIVNGLASQFRDDSQVQVAEAHYQKSVQRFGRFVAALRARAQAPPLPLVMRLIRPDGAAKRSLEKSITEPGAVVAQLQAASDTGDLKAKVKLALLYVNGVSVEKNGAKALALLQQAAAGDSPDAQEALGYFYSNGELGPRDNVEAVRWLEKAARAGSVAAQTNLAACLGMDRELRKISLGQTSGYAKPRTMVELSLRVISGCSI